MKTDCCKGHMTLPLPAIAAPVMSLSSLVEDLTYAANYPIGVSPILVPPYVWIIHRAWAAFGIAEALGSAENHTKVTFYVGDNFAGGTAIGSVTTSANPAAGAPLVVYLKNIPEYGKMIFASPTQVGVGSTSMTNERFAFGVDLLPMRAA